MRLSTKGRYAVMEIADLARYGDGGPVSLGDVCEKPVLGTSGLAQRGRYRAANAR